MTAILDRTSRSGRDQARGLRALLQSRTAQDFPSNQPTCHTIAVTSGKGGVGKSHIALNLAVALAESGRRVCLVDGNLGLGTLDLLCGLNGYWNLSHVVTGARSLEDIVLNGPAGIHLVPGGSGIAALADCPISAQRQLLQELQSLEREHNVLLIDTGSGIHQLVRQFALAADDVLIVTTPEPTAIADAYATVKALSTSTTALHVVINRADSATQAQQVFECIEKTARLFLRTRLKSGGWVPRDSAVPAAERLRKPFVHSDAHAPATRAVRRLAGTIVESSNSSVNRGGFFSRLWTKADSQ